MCSNEYISKDNIEATKIFVTGIFESFFKPWHMITEECKERNIPKWRSRFLAHQTFLNIKISLFGFLGYCEKMVTLLNPERSPMFQTINVLHSNTSIIEALFSFISMQSAGTLDSQSYESATRNVGGKMLKKALDTNQYYEGTNIADNRDTVTLSDSITLNTQQALAGLRKKNLKPIVDCIAINSNNWYTRDKALSDTCAFIERPSMKEIVRAFWEVTAIDEGRLHIFIYSKKKNQY